VSLQFFREILGMLTRNTFSLPDNIELEEQDERGKKTAKLCVTSGTIILAMLREDRNKTRK